MDTMQGLKRTDYCGTFTAADDGRQAVVCGWVQRVRDKGMLVFIDLRDRTGVMQLAFDDKTCLLYTSAGDNDFAAAIGKLYRCDRQRRQAHEGDDA